MIEDAPTYDFICLCCGARNGERSPSCSYVKRLVNSTDSLDEILILARWLASSDYKGSIIVPSNYQLDTAYRLRIVEMTDHYRKSRTGSGVLIFSLPGLSINNQVISISQFLN